MGIRASRVVTVLAGVSAVVAVSGAFTGVSAQSGPTGSLTGVMVKAHTRGLLPLLGGSRAGSVDSLNWSGYVVQPASPVTGVSSTHVVPAAGLVPPGFAASWAGIGGFTTGDLIQAGVSEQSLPDNPVTGPQYFAWYELLPAGETQISGCTGDANCTVTPGDVMSVNISQASGSTWNIDMADAGKWSYHNNVTYSSSRSSADWILEAPTFLVLQTLMAPVGTVHFAASTFTDGSGTHTIAQGNPTEVILTPGIINEATPSPLAPDGQSFDVCAYAQTCS